MGEIGISWPTDVLPLIVFVDGGVHDPKSDNTCTLMSKEGALKVTLVYRVSHKRRPMAIISKVDIFKYFTFLIITELIKNIFSILRNRRLFV